MVNLKPSFLSVGKHSPFADTDPKILIVGLGDPRCGDDGVGVHAVRLIRRQHPYFWDHDVTILEAGVELLCALCALEGVDLVLVIDAMRAGAAPGTVHPVDEPDLTEWDIQTGPREKDLCNALRLMIGPLPHVAVLGVEPENADYGRELSQTVKRALPGVAATAVDYVRRWINTPLGAASAASSGVR
jgi:hydrogenase maturation protease